MAAVPLKVRQALILGVVPLILYVGILGILPLMEPDEARYLLIPQAMNETGDFVTPTLKGVAYLEKPPLAYWMTAGMIRTFGSGDGAARLFVGLCAWGCILLAYCMGRRLDDEETGLTAAAVLGTSLLFFVLGRINILDMPLAFFQACALWSGYLYFAEAKDRSRLWLYFLYLFAAAAFLTKGLIGFVFPFGILGLWLMIRRRWRDILALFSPVGMAILAAATAPWLIVCAKANPDFLWFYFVHEHYLRYTTAVHERTAPFWYFLPVVLGGFVPWIAYLPRAWAGRHNPFRVLDRDLLLFLGIWIGAIFLFFSASSSKLASYMSPLLPPLAVLAAVILRSGEEHVAFRFRWAEALPGAQAILLAAVVAVPFFVPEYRKLGLPAWGWLLLPVLAQALIVALPDRLEARAKGAGFLAVFCLSALYLGAVLVPAGHYLTPGKTSLDIVRAMKTVVPAGETLYQYKVNFYGIDAYTGMRTPIVDDIGELKFGADRIAPEERQRRFPTAQAFAAEIREGAVRYAVTEGQGHVNGLKTLVPSVEVLWDNGKFYLLRLKGEAS